MSTPEPPERPKCFRPWTDQIALGIVDHENLRHATAACAACLADLVDVMREGDARSESEDYGEYCSRMRLTFAFDGAVEDSDEEWIRWWWEVAGVIFDAYERLTELGQLELYDLLRNGLTETEPDVDMAWLTRFQMANACWHLDSLAGMMRERQ